MAASGYTPISIYHSTTASAAPTAGNLVNGELAINILDGKLYYKDNGGVVQVIATKGTGTIGGSTTQVQYNNAGALAGSANFTFNGTTATINTLNLTNALGAAYGGTAQSTYAQGDLLYASAANTLAKLPIGINTYILTSNGTIPGWSIPSSVVIGTATNLAGGAAGSVPYQSGASTTTFLSIGTVNQVITSTGSAPQWSSALTLTGLSNSGLTTLDKTVTVGNTSFNGAAVFAPATPAKVYLGTGTVTDVTSAIAATNADGAIVALGITPIAATNANVTYTNASTLYIAGAPSAGTNITITNPYALYVAAGDAYFGASVSATTLDLTNLEVTNIKAKDGTASMTLADSTGVVTFSANPVLNAGTANGVPYLNASKVLTTGSALTFDGTNLGNTRSVATAFSGTNAATWANGIVLTNTATPAAGVASLILFQGISNVNSAFGVTQNASGFGDFVWAGYSGSFSEQMRLTSTGLGIGTSSPLAKLDVQGGSIKVKGYDNPNNSDGYSLLSGVTGNIGYIQSYYGNGSAVVGAPLTFDASYFAWRNIDAGYAERMRLDSSGNLGLGVTPSAWGSNFKALESTAGNSFYATSSASALASNAFNDNSNWRYKTTAPASLFATIQGQAVWLNAPSGTANSAVVAASTSYTVVALGTTTLGEWQASFSGLSAIPTLGQVLTSLGSPVSPIPNGGLVTQNISFIQAMTLDASGNLGIGLTSVNPTGLAILSGGQAKGVLIGRNSSGSPTSGQSLGSYAFKGIADGVNTNAASEAMIEAVAAENQTGLSAATNMLFYTKASGTGPGSAPTERLRITSGGYLGISAQTPVNYLDMGDSSAGRGITWNNYSNVFSEYSSGALILSSNYYGNIGSGGYKTTITQTFGAAGIQVSGTSGGGNGGLIQFFVDPATAKTAGNAFTPTERARIDPDGTFRVKGAGTAGSTDAFQVAGAAPADAARITSAGDLLVGTQTSGGKLTVEQGNANANGAFITNQTYNYQTLGLHNTATANDNILVAFGTEASYTTRGSIQYNRGAGLIAYLTTSDYRAKDISGPVVDSGALIDSVPVYMGKMKGATQERPMFIAHETPAYAHTGVKDAVDADGKPVYQQMDASALVPVMWAEIQSLRARVAQLEQGA